MKSKLPALVSLLTLLGIASQSVAGVPTAAKQDAGSDVIYLVALSIGVNQSAEAHLQTLRYADDDAIRYTDLFATLGAETFLLTQADENTTRLHPDRAREARPPSKAILRATLKVIAAKVDKAKAAGLRPVFYLLYAGHGDRDRSTGQGYLTLGDGRLRANALHKEIVSQVAADEFHFVIDACNADFLAMSRGAGGKRRALSGFIDEVAHGMRDPRVGLLFATSSMFKTFEFEGFQAGVFSHLVRSGLYGAADFNMDGRVTYQEIQKFVVHASNPVKNEKYRPTVHALRPNVTHDILDIRPGLARGRIEVPASTPSAHHVVEDGNGVRLLDFHNGDRPMHFVQPQSDADVAILRQGLRPQEFTLPTSLKKPVVLLTELPRKSIAIASRGATENAFALLFSAAYSNQALSGLSVGDRDFLTVMDDAAEAQRQEERSQRQKWALGVWALGGALAAGGTMAALKAGQLTKEPGAGFEQRDIVERNQQMNNWQNRAYWSFGLSGAAAIGGALLYFWDSDSVSRRDVQVGISPEGVILGGRF